MLVGYEKQINFKKQVQQFAFCTTWSLKILKCSNILITNHLSFTSECKILGLGILISMPGWQHITYFNSKMYFHVKRIYTDVLFFSLNKLHLVKAKTVSHCLKTLNILTRTLDNNKAFLDKTVTFNVAQAMIPHSASGRKTYSKNQNDKKFGHKLLKPLELVIPT